MKTTCINWPERKSLPRHRGRLFVSEFWIKIVILFIQVHFDDPICRSLPRDAMRKRGICCRPVSVRPSRLCIVSRRLKISSHFFLGSVAPWL